MTAQPVRLKHLIRQRHWQTYRTFCGEYDKAAKALDHELIGTWPSRAQLHRWLSGELKGLPYPDHCRILEAMFPGWAAADLFEPVGADERGSPTGKDSPPSDLPRLFEMIGAGLGSPDPARADWGFLDDARSGLSTSQS